MLKKITTFILSLAVTAAIGVPVPAEASSEIPEQAAAEKTADRATPEAPDSAGSAMDGDLSNLLYTVDGLNITVPSCQVRKNNNRAAELFIAVYDNDCLAAIKKFDIPEASTDADLDEFTVTLSFEPTNLKVKAFMWSADDSCVPFAKAEELPGIQGDVYTVYGRVTVSPTGGAAQGIKKDEIVFNIEQSDNFCGRPITADKPETVTANIGNTNADDMLFIYSEAKIAKNNESYTIVSITPCGDNQTVTFGANDVADDDWLIGIEYVENKKLPVYESETSSSTIKYDLSTDDSNSVDARIYVNGVDAGVVTNDTIEEYILNNYTGTVTLVDITAAGSTANDGKYEYIMVDYYVDAVVDSVTTSSTYARIYFKDSEAAIRMQWDPSDEDVNITFTKDGAEIAYTDLAEYDVLSIAYDVVNEGENLTGNTYYDVRVSSKTVTGTVTHRNSEENTVRIDGVNYCVIYRYDVISDIELSTNYTLYLDVFGRAAYIDESNSEKNYGVIVAMYRTAGNDEYTVRMVTANAEIVEYECENSVEADTFYTYAVTGGVPSWDNPIQQVRAITKLDIRSQIMSGSTVCTYKLGNGKVRFDKAINGMGGENLEYKANSVRLGSYHLTEGTTKLINMDNYMSETNSDPTVSTLTVSAFEDEATYHAYLFDKNNDGDFRFGIVFGGVSSIKSESTVAIVQNVEGVTEIDSTTCTELTVARDGREDIKVLVEGDDIAAREGSVIAYVVGSDGYVEDGELYVLMTASSSYNYQRMELLDNANFAENISHANIIEYGKYKGFATPNYASTTSKDVVLYYGIVYTSSDSVLNLFTSADTEGGAEVSAVNKVQSFYVGDANKYVFNFNNKYGHRVSAGSLTQPAKIFSSAYCTETGDEDSANDRKYVSWDFVDNENITPALALVKQVDGAVIDVIYYTLPYNDADYPDDPDDQQAKNYGVIVDMHTSSESSCPIVKMITADAETVEYECKDNTEADAFYSYAADGLTIDKGEYTFTTDDIRDNIVKGGTVCAYELTDDNKLIFGKGLTGVGGNEIEFSTRLSSLGSYPVSDGVTKLIDMKDYMSDTTGNLTAAAFDISEFENEAVYDAYLFDRNSYGDYRFGVILSKSYPLKSESAMAIVQDVVGTTEVNGTECTELTVARNGQKDITVLVEGYNVSVNEGSVIAYGIGRDGYVEDGDLYVLVNAGSSYLNQMTALLDKSNFAEKIGNATIIGEGKYKGFATPSYASTTSKDVVLYYGVVYKKSAKDLELFTSANVLANGNKISSVNGVQSFSVVGANQYVYDFGQKSDWRVSVGSQTQAATVFNHTYCREDGSDDVGNDRNFVSWDCGLAEDATPAMALVKEVDGDVIDVMYFVAP